MKKKIKRAQKLGLAAVIASTSIALGLAFVAPEVSARVKKPKIPKKPNIIVMLADDYGKDAASLYNPETEDPDFPLNAPTPNLGKLAKHGVLFNQAWAMPACSTTRGTRTLGKLPSTSGMGWPLGQFTPRVGAAGPFEGVLFPPTMINPNDPHTIQRLAKRV